MSFKYVIPNLPLGLSSLVAVSCAVVTVTAGITSHTFTLIAIGVIGA
jgi:hypothetical protein